MIGKTSPFILMQLLITTICLVRIGVLYHICETSECDRIRTSVIKQSKGLSGDLKPEH